MTEHPLAGRPMLLPQHVQERIIALYLRLDGLTRDKLHLVAGLLGLTVPPDLDLAQYFVSRDGSAQVIMQPDALMYLVEDLQNLAHAQSGSIVLDSFQAMQSSSGMVSPSAGGRHQHQDDDEVLDRAEFSSAVQSMFHDHELAERAADTFFGTGPDRADLTAFKRLLDEEQWKGVVLSSLLASYAFEQCGALEDLTGCGLILTVRQAKAVAFSYRLSYSCLGRLTTELEALVAAETGDISFAAFKRLLETELSATTPATAMTCPVGVLALVSVAAPEVLISSVGPQIQQTLRSRALTREVQRSQSFIVRSKLEAAEEETDEADTMSPEELAAILNKGTAPRKKKNPWLVIPRFMNVPYDDEVTANIKQRVAHRRELAEKRKKGGGPVRRIGLMVQCSPGRFPSVVTSKLTFSYPAEDWDDASDASVPPLGSDRKKTPRGGSASARGAHPPTPPRVPGSAPLKRCSLPAKTMPDGTQPLAKLFCIAPSPRRSAEQAQQLPPARPASGSQLPVSASAKTLYHERVARGSVVAL